MARLFWIAVGFLAGVIISGVSAVVVYLWLLSPVHIVERIVGWNVPSDVRLISQRDERDGFFGQGSTLTIFLVPGEYSDQILRACPRRFKHGTIEQSGIQEKDSGIPGGAPACFLSKED